MLISLGSSYVLHADMFVHVLDGERCFLFLAFTELALSFGSLIMWQTAPHLGFFISVRLRGLEHSRIVSPAVSMCFPARR